MANGTEPGTDPPIIVGGGGSSYVWVRLDQDERPVNPESDDDDFGVKKKAPKPKTRGKYGCNRNKHKAKKIVFFDGKNNPVTYKIEDDDTFWITVE